MNEGKTRLLFVGIAVACLALASIGCSNYQPNKITFRFTSVPVLTPDVFSGTPVSVNPATCSVFIADEAFAALDTKERTSFERWLDDIGFVVRKSYSPSFNKGVVYYILQVPSGSVPDAITLLTKQRGVQQANTSSFDIKFPEARSAGDYLGCKTPATTPTPPSETQPPAPSSTQTPPAVTSDLTGTT